MPVGSSIFIAARTITALGRRVTSRWRQRYGPVPRSADVGAIGVCSCCSDAMAGRTITKRIYRVYTQQRLQVRYRRRTADRPDGMS